jgi:hypothetical protein
MELFFNENAEIPVPTRKIKNLTSCRIDVNSSGLIIMISEFRFIGM